MPIHNFKILILSLPISLSLYLSLSPYLPLSLSISLFPSLSPSHSLPLCLSVCTIWFQRPRVKVSKFCLCLGYTQVWPAICMKAFDTKNNSPERMSASNPDNRVRWKCVFLNICAETFFSDAVLEQIIYIFIALAPPFRSTLIKKSGHAQTPLRLNLWILQNVMRNNVSISLCISIFMTFQTVSIIYVHLIFSIYH